MVVNYSVSLSVGQTLVFNSPSLSVTLNSTSNRVIVKDKSVSLTANDSIFVKYKYGYIFCNNSIILKNISINK